MADPSVFEMHHDVESIPVVSCRVGPCALHHRLDVGRVNVILMYC
jgi:hypothetical protein